MPNEPKIEFDDLEKLGGTEKETPKYSREGLLSIVADQNKLKSVYQEDGINFLRKLYEEMASSQEFRTEVLSALKDKRK